MIKVGYNIRIHTEKPYRETIQRNHTEKPYRETIQRNHSKG